MASTPSPGGASVKSSDGDPSKAAPDTLHERQFESLKEHLAFATFVLQAIHGGKRPTLAELAQLERQQYDICNPFGDFYNDPDSPSSPWRESYTPPDAWSDLKTMESAIRKYIKKAEERLRSVRLMLDIGCSVCCKCNGHHGVDRGLNRKIRISSSAVCLWRRVLDVHDFMSPDFLMNHENSVYDYVRSCAADGLTTDQLNALWIDCHRSSRLPPTGGNLSSNVMAKAIATAKAEAKSWTHHAEAPDGLNMQELVAEMERCENACPARRAEADKKRKDKEEEEIWRATKKVKSEHGEQENWTPVTLETLNPPPFPDVIVVKDEELRPVARLPVRTSQPNSKRIKTEQLDTKASITVKKE